MNYLSHHIVARRAFGPKASPDLLSGNLLPDLLPTCGDGRVRQIAANISPEWADLATGARLHLDTDKLFHGHPQFKKLCEKASGMLRALTFTTPPKRVFFVAHVAVELTLDARALERESGIADDLYRSLQNVGGTRLAEGAEILTGAPAPNLADGVTRFIASGFLRTYNQPGGLAQALHRVSLRAGLLPVENNQDRQTLESFFDDLLPRVAEAEDSLWTPPPSALQQP